MRKEGTFKETNHGPPIKTSILTMAYDLCEDDCRPGFRSSAGECLCRTEGRGQYTCPNRILKALWVLDNI